MPIAFSHRIHLNIARWSTIPELVFEETNYQCSPMLLNCYKRKEKALPTTDLAEPTEMSASTNTLPCPSEQKPVTLRPENQSTHVSAQTPQSTKS